MEGPLTKLAFSSTEMTVGSMVDTGSTVIDAVSTIPYLIGNALIALSAAFGS